MKVLNVIRTTENLKDKNSDSYLRAIQRRAAKEGVEVKVLTKCMTTSIIKFFLKDNPNTIVMEPCEYEFDRMQTLDKNLTAKAIFNLINETCEDMEYKPTVTILNRSNLIGNPLYKMLRDADYTPVQCHSKTSKDSLFELLTISEIVVTATGTDMTPDFEIAEVCQSSIIDVSNDVICAYKLADQREIGKRTIDLLFQELKKVQ